MLCQHISKLKMILLLDSCRSAGFTPWLFLWRSWRHPPCSQTQTVSEAGCGPASPSACSPPLWQLLSRNKTKPRREFNSCGRSNESVEDTEKDIEEETRWLCSPLAITQLIWELGTWSRMRKGVTLALESSTVSRAPTRRPAKQHDTRSDGNVF